MDISLYFTPGGIVLQSLKMHHVVQVVVRTVNFVRTRGLNHRQFTVFSVIRRLLIYVGNLKTLCANNHFQKL